MTIKFGVMITPTLSFSDSVKDAQRLEKLGFDSVWLADHILFLDRKGVCLDPWPIMAALAPYTERVTYGSMVTDPFRRHPAVFAQTLATIDRITEGRLILGIGAGEAMNVAPFNIPWDRRARRLAETVKVLKMLWTGEPTDFQGEFYKLDQAFLQALPSREEGVPVYIAANSPFTRKIAGRLGDGWISEMLSPELYARDLEAVLKAAEKADRGSNIDVVYHVFSAISENREAAKAHANGLVKMQFTWWPKQLERYGFKISDRCDWNRIVVDDESFRESKELSEEVPEEVADLLTISGDVDECIGKIEDYVEAGVTHFAFSIPGYWDETLESLGKTVIPYFKEIHSE